MTDFLPFSTEELIKTLCNAAVNAGKIISDIYKNDFSVEFKSDNTPVTIADKEADRYINSVLAKKFPTVSRLSEETADDRSRLENELCFIIDPLDGTKDFVKKNGEFTVNIGLSFRNKAVAGVIYVPITDELFYAVYKKGAYKTTSSELDELFDQSRRIHVSDRTKDLLVLRSRSNHDSRTEELLNRHKNAIKSMTAIGSSKKGCIIAQGLADVYYRFGKTSEWDTCAMQAIVENAGGIFLQADGSQMTYNRQNVVNEKGFMVLNRKENIWTHGIT